MYFTTGHSLACKKIYKASHQKLLFRWYPSYIVDVFCDLESNWTIENSVAYCKDIKFVKIDYVINGMQKVRVKVARQTSRGFSN